MIGRAADLVFSASEKLGRAAVGVLARMEPMAALAQDEERLAAFVRREIGGTSHVGGTCRMGRPDDPYSVVDSVGRLIGMKGLRIVDGSVMPIVPGGNTHMPVAMLANKMADEVLHGCTSTDALRHGRSA